MIHSRPDYNRIQDPALNDPTLLSEGATAISEDEPVILFRAKDKHLVDLLTDYIALNELDPEPKENFDVFVSTIENHIKKVIDWQEKNGCKTPDL